MDAGYWQPYFDAVGQNDVNSVRTAAAKCGPLTDGSFGVLALRMAVQFGSPALVDAFLESGTSPDVIEGDWRSTPLMWAARSGHMTIVRALIQAGADLEAKDLSGRTPLFYAALGQRADVARLLLDVGANVEHRDGGGRSAMAAARYREVRLRFLGWGISGRIFIPFSKSETYRILREATSGTRGRRQ